MARSAMHLPDAVTGAGRHRAACECVRTHTRITPAQLDWALSRVDLARDSILAQTCQCLRCARIEQALPVSSLVKAMPVKARERA